MFLINIISVIFLIPSFWIPFKYAFNCGSRKISNFEKWLGLPRNLATSALNYTWVKSQILRSAFAVECLYNLIKTLNLAFQWEWPLSAFQWEYVDVTHKRPSLISSPTYRYTSPFNWSAEEDPNAESPEDSVLSHIHIYIL